jgi:hypothetical protein
MPPPKATVSSGLLRLRALDPTIVTARRLLTAPSA